MNIGEVQGVWILEPIEETNEPELIDTLPVEEEIPQEVLIAS